MSDLLEVLLAVFDAVRDERKERDVLLFDNGIDFLTSPYLCFISDRYGKSSVFFISPWVTLKMMCYKILYICIDIRVVG